MQINTQKYKRPQNAQKFRRISKNQADLQNLGAYPKIRWIYKILALFQKSGGFQNSGGFPKSRSLQKIRRPYCLGSAESPAADLLLVWLKSSRSDPRRCDVPLMQSPSERWTACTLLLFAHSLPYCTGCLYMPKFPRKSKN
jgi:hypothetical protein